MNAVRRRREHVLEERRKQAEEQRLAELKKLKEETMKCNIIAQRIAIQEFLLAKDGIISTKLDDILQNDEEAKTLDRKAIEDLLDQWLDEFRLVQPTEYFLEHPTDDYELVCNIQTKRHRHGHRRLHDESFIGVVCIRLLRTTRQRLWSSNSNVLGGKFRREYDRRHDFGFLLLFF